MAELILTPWQRIRVDSAAAVVVAAVWDSLETEPLLDEHATGEIAHAMADTFRRLCAERIGTDAGNQPRRIPEGDADVASAGLAVG